jgi:hypothetical protein
MRIIKLSRCSGRIWWDLPLECGCYVSDDTYYLKVKKSGSCQWEHVFSHDFLDGHRVGFELDDDLRNICKGYYYVGLFEGCDQIGEAMLVKDKKTVNNVSVQEKDMTCSGCNLLECECVPSPVLNNSCEPQCVEKCVPAQQPKMDCEPCQE